MDRSEFQLMRAIGKGDHLAFKHLVKRYENPLLNFVYRYVGDRQTAEDLTQEVLLKIYEAAPRFEPRAKVSTWIFKIAYNLSMNELKRRQRLLDLDYPLDSREQCCSSLSFPNPIERIALGQAIAKALVQLPENQRAALLLRTGENLSYREIAEILGVSLSSVESLLFRARARLRELLQKDYVR